MPTSETHIFNQTKSSEFITDAFERIGLLPDLIDAQKIQSAQRSANLLLSEWINKGLNLWTIKQGIIGLVPFQATYILPNATSDILNATVRTSVRNLGGVAFSSAGGIASNAFNNNSLTACTQDDPDGYISYNYGNNNNYFISMLGITSNIDNEYQISFQYSFDNINWISLLDTEESIYPEGITVWHAIPAPRSAQYFRILETGGSTLDIQELYFNNLLQDTIITRISDSDYTSIPNKNQPGRPTSYWLDRQVNPLVYLWPVPTPLYTTLYYTRVEMIQDIGAMIDMTNIPQRFYESFVGGLAAKLSLKFAPERFDILLRDYREAFDIAAREDTQKVPLRIYGDYSQGWSAS